MAPIFESRRKRMTVMENVFRSAQTPGYMEHGSFSAREVAPPPTKIGIQAKSAAVRYGRAVLTDMAGCVTPFPLDRYVFTSPVTSDDVFARCRSACTLADLCTELHNAKIARGQASERPEMPVRQPLPSSDRDLFLAQHEVQYYSGRVPLRQGFTIVTLATQDNAFGDKSKLWQRVPGQTDSQLLRRVITSYRTVLRRMQCVESTAIPGTHSRIYHRMFAPDKTRCDGCPFAQHLSHGCVLKSPTIKKAVLERVYPTEADNDTAPDPPIHHHADGVTQWTLFVVPSPHR